MSYEDDTWDVFCEFTRNLHEIIVCNIDCLPWQMEWLPGYKGPGYETTHNLTKQIVYDWHFPTASAYNDLYFDIFSAAIPDELW